VRVTNLVITDPPKARVTNSAQQVTRRMGERGVPHLRLSGAKHLEGIVSLGVEWVDPDGDLLQAPRAVAGGAP
jgi:hypothetical protein